jgi:hypothetical protein
MPVPLLMIVNIIEQLNLARGSSISILVASSRRLLSDVDKWYDTWRAQHLIRFTEDHVLLAVLELEYSNARLWTVCMGLRGCDWRNVSLKRKKC